MRIPGSIVAVSVLVLHSACGTLEPGELTLGRSAQYGTDTNGTDTNGTDTNGTDTNGTDTNGTDTNGTDTNGTDTNGSSLHDVTLQGTLFAARTATGTAL